MQHRVHGKTMAPGVRCGNRVNQPVPSLDLRSSAARFGETRCQAGIEGYIGDADCSASVAGSGFGDIMRPE